MSTRNTFMDKLRSFFGFQQEPPRNDFRNPIWGSDDDDDEDELYTRQNIDQFVDPAELHKHLSKQMQEMFKSFGSMFGDVKLFFQEEQCDAITCFPEIPEPEGFDGNNIRDYYLKPGYQNHIHEHPCEDIDLDGKISSHEISGLLKQKEDGKRSIPPFDGNLVPGRSFCQTIITTSVTKPDGTVETRRIIKNGNEVFEETTTSGGPDSKPFNTGLDQLSPPGVIYHNILSEFTSLFRNVY